MSLIAALNQLQEEEGYLTDQALRLLSAQRNIPLHAIQAVISFYPHFRTTAPPKARVAVCRDMVCTLAGSDPLCDRLKNALAGKDAEVHTVSCLGRCDTAPAATINDVPVGGGDSQTLIRMLSSPTPTILPRLPRRRREWPFVAYEHEAEHYRVIRRLRDGEPYDVVGILKQSGLAGCGGAAFPTGVKWELVAKQPDPVKFVICNADESEPGTFKDRVILAELPHLVLEGMMIAAHVTQAQKAYVFIRHEYEPEKQLLKAELESARLQGLLDSQFDIEIFTSPGGYILGEETALLECMEDKRGEPRNKPPFPGQVGLHGKPTLINNVETFAAATAILNHGADWWESIGAKGCQGFKFMSVCGHVQNPDVYQIRSGTTVRNLIDMAGGMKDGKELKAFAPGGASSNFLPAEKADTPIDFDHLSKAGSMLGSGALFVVAEGTDMMQLGTNVVRFFRNESCGKCVPCRVGTEKAVKMLQDMLVNGGRREQLELLDELADTMLQTSICGLGQVALNPILSVTKHFPNDVAAHVK